MLNRKTLENGNIEFEDFAASSGAPFVGQELELPMTASGWTVARFIVTAVRTEGSKVYAQARPMTDEDKVAPKAQAVAVKRATPTKKATGKTVVSVNPMAYTVRAYSSRKAGESGRCTPVYSTNTGSHATAVHDAKGMAEEYGAAVVVNNETGNRVWFERT